MPKFINTELKSASESDSDLDSDSYLELDDKKLIEKFKKIWYWFWLWFWF